jgi:glycosyltransferase involved in cell wall biosynthesis
MNRGSRTPSRATDPEGRPTVRILGTHGIPAGYGGFETAAEHVARWLVSRGWRAIVYCQTTSGHEGPWHDTWQGIERIFVATDREGWHGTSEFDLTCIRDATRHDDLCLTFGYNTALFNLMNWGKGIPNVVNMDGMEWTRARWGKAKQGILLANERIACRTATHLIADHPVIYDYLVKHADPRRVTTITYGADAVTAAPTDPLAQWDLVPGDYSTVICRPIPENSLLEIVRAFSTTTRNHRLVVLGDLLEDDEYHQALRAAASSEVIFPGAIYDPAVVRALRFHSRAYLHGHTVGGTNPSLVEAMGAGNPVIAHDNPYNRWVAGDEARFFSTTSDLEEVLDSVLGDPAALRRMGEASRRRHASEFTWEHVASQYEELLAGYLAGSGTWRRFGRARAESYEGAR